MKYNVYEEEYDEFEDGFKGYFCGYLIAEGLQFDNFGELYEYAKRLEKHYNLKKVVFSEYDYDDEGKPEPEEDEDKTLFKVRHYENDTYGTVEVDWFYDDDYDF